MAGEDVVVREGKAFFELMSDILLDAGNVSSEDSLDSDEASTVSLYVCIACQILHGGFDEGDKQLCKCPEKDERIRS